MVMDQLNNYQKANYFYDRAQAFQTSALENDGEVAKTYMNLANAMLNEAIIYHTKAVEEDRA